MAKHRSISQDEIMLEYVSFGELLSNEDLESLRSPYNKSVMIMLNTFLKPIIIEYKNSLGQYTIITPISSNLDITKNFIDNRILRKEYETKSYTESLKAAFGVLRNNDVNEAWTPSAPDHPMVRRSFIAFQKELRVVKKEMIESIKNEEYFPLNYNFGNTNDMYKMTNDQKINREKMLEIKNRDPEKFNILWTSGDFHLATIVARLEKASFPELLLMREEILSKNNISVSIKDYGLTVNEINAGLQSSSKTNERYLFKCFVDGNINLKGVLQILRNLDKIDPAEKHLAIRTVQALTNDFDCRFEKKEENQKSFPYIKKFLKKYNVSAHKKWREEK